MVAKAMSLRRATAELAEHARRGLDMAGFASGALELLERFIGCETGMYATLRGGGPFALRNLDGQARAVFDLLERRPARYALSIRHVFSSALERRAVVDSQVPSRHHAPVYDELFRPIGLRSVLMLAPTWNGCPLGIFGLHRYDLRSFSSAQRDRALAVLPMLELACALQQLHRNGATSPIEALTPREREVAHHVARGLTTPQIALVLGSSPFTVRNQLGRIFDKLGVASRAELASYLARAS